jgi:hypothetical protein
LKKLCDYLHSPQGKNEILNPKGKKPVRKCLFVTEEITQRFRKGVKEWIKGKDVVSEIEKLDEIVTQKIKEVQIELERVQVSIMGRELEEKIKVAFIDFDIFDMIAVTPFPLGKIFGNTNEKEIDTLYAFCVNLLKTTELPALIRSIYNDHFQPRIRCVFEKDLPERILHTSHQISYLSTERDNISNNLHQILALRDSLHEIKSEIEKINLTLLQ